jgi:hypothetical protein
MKEFAANSSVSNRTQEIFTSRVNLILLRRSLCYLGTLANMKGAKYGLQMPIFRFAHAFSSAEGGSPCRHPVMAKATPGGNIVD